MKRISSRFRSLAGALALGVAAVPLSLPLVGGQAAAQASAGQIDAAVAALRGITTLKADFQQTDRSGQRVRGQLTLKRPGRIRFEYEKSVNMLIVGDGKSLTLVDYDVQQVQRWPIKNSPLGALLDPSRDVGKYGKLLPTGNPNVMSVEVRDTKHPEYGIITLIFMRNPTAPGGWQLDRWVSLDSQNKRTSIVLTNHRYGASVPDSTFRWKDPRPRVRR
ncbi:MAG: outer membrane lipoprotein carrier protein LolA [Sphingomonadaceae bacterium]